MVAHNQIVFHVHLNYIDDPSQVRKKGRGKKELDNIILMHFLMLHFCVLDSWDLLFLYCIKGYYLARDFMRYASLLSKASVMGSLETKYGPPSATS